MHRLPLLAVASALVILTGCKVAVSPSADPSASSHSTHKSSHSSAKAAKDPRGDAHPAGIGTGPLRLLIEPADGLTTIDKLITGARSSVNLTMYELRDTTAEKDLAADAARGVDVRVLLDRHLEKSRNSATCAYLAAHKVHVAWTIRAPGTSR
jgi:cardiolipin synthase A/B